MFTLTGNRLIDVIIIFAVVYGLTELITWLFKKYFLKDKSKPLMEVKDESVDNNSFNWTWLK